MLRSVETIQEANMDRNLRLFVVPPVRSSIKTSFFNTTLAFHGIATDMQEADSTGSRYKKRTRNGLNVSYVAKQLRRSLQIGRAHV